MRISFLMRVVGYLGCVFNGIYFTHAREYLDGGRRAWTHRYVLGIQVTRIVFGVA